MLVNVASAEVPGLLRVNPGNPDASYIVQKIEGIAAVGVRMPANGPPYLPQDRIDLVRRWIAAGAPMSSAPPDRLIVTSTIPAVSEIAAPGLGKLTVVFNANVDSSRASADTFTLRDAADQPVVLSGVRVPVGRQNVVELTTAQPLAAGSYQLAVRLHNEVPGIVVPEPLQEALRDAGANEAEVGFAHARELLAAARDRCAGVYLVAPYRKPLTVLELLS